MRHSEKNDIEDCVVTQDLNQLLENVIPELVKDEFIHYEVDPHLLIFGLAS